MQLAMIGLGRMGATMTRRPLCAGHRVAAQAMCDTFGGHLGTSE